MVDGLNAMAVFFAVEQELSRNTKPINKNDLN
jgi:hypothetical protein